MNLTLAAQPISVDREGAAALLGISAKTFDRHVRPHIRCIRPSPQTVLFLVEDLIAWARDNANRALRDAA